jgi:hypothetical protein
MLFHMHSQSNLDMQLRCCNISSSHSSGADDPGVSDMMLCCWASGTHHLCVHIHFFETSGTTHPITQHHIPAELGLHGLRPLKITEYHKKRSLGETLSFDR